MPPEPPFFEEQSKPLAWDELAADEEYEAGYRARYLDSSEYLTATRAWRAGWMEADREITHSGSSGPTYSGLSTVTCTTEWSLFGSGRDARVCALPFDTRRDQVWKRSWIEADLELGTEHFRSSSK